MTTGSLWAPERGFAPVGYDTHVLDITYATPGLQTGVEIFTPATEGVVIAFAFSWVNVTEVFDGTTPSMFIGFEGGVEADAITTFAPLTATSAGDTGWYAPGVLDDATGTSGLGFVVLTGLQTIVVVVDDGSAGPVGGTAGAATVVLSTSTTGG